MGIFTFKWEHPAEEVHVTGTFDDWTKSVKLEKVGDVWEKEVELPPISEKVYYKFVVDNNWVINQSAPQELDPSNNVNNVLLPQDIKSKPELAIMSNVAPDATTVGLASQVPLEEKSNKEVAQPAEELNEKKEPMATPSDIPGGYPVTPANELEKTFSVNPLPATVGGINPVNIQPGEPIPPTVASDNIHEHVKLDKESYEKSDSLPGFEGLPPLSHTMIPESSLPILQNAINSVHPGATTTQLASEVPLEAKVPTIVKESQEKAHFDPEASAIPEEVREKAAVEKELLETVDPAPSTSEGTAGIGTEKTENSTALGAAAATAGGAVLASAVIAKDAIAEAAAPLVSQATAAVASAVDNLPPSVKEQLPESVQSAIAAETKEETIQEVSPEVPQEVKESIVESGEAPEAAANTEAVEAKKEVESELLKEAKAAGVPKPEEHKVEEAPKTIAIVHTPVIEEPKPREELPKLFDAPKPVETTPEVTEAPKTTEAAPQVIEAPQPAAEIPAVSEPQPAAADSDKTADSAEHVTGEAASSVPSKSSSFEKKKKNRISTFFGKIKSKFTGGGSTGTTTTTTTTTTTDSPSSPKDTTAA